MLIEEDRKTLLELSGAAISHELYQYVPLEVDPQAYVPAIREIGAAFVTLQIEGTLRGCIGTLEAHRPLVVDVARNAGAAAFADPRFERLSRSEFERIDIHISVLSPAQNIDFFAEADLLSKIRPHTDGLVLSDGPRRGTFLPDVWRNFPEPKQFLCQLKLKAGLAPDHWSDTIKVQRYTTESFP